MWINYEWTDTGGVDHIVNGARRITSGPYAAVAGNLSIMRVDRAVPATTAGQRRRRVPGRRTVTRGRSFQLRPWPRTGYAPG